MCSRALPTGSHVGCWEPRGWPIAQYLVVAHRTAKSPELAAKLKEILAKDHEARFVLLVPALPPPGWVYEENEVRKRAEEEAQAAKEALKA